MLARQMRWSILTIVVAVTAACTDAVAPTPDQADRLPGGAPRPAIVINEMAADQSYAEFTVDAGGGHFKLGKHRVWIPRNAICDPATSGYGPAYWDADCAVISAPIRMRAELRQQDGREWIYFTPHVRFRPSSNPFQWVWMYMRTDAAVERDQPPTILWSPDYGLPGIDESLSDPTLRTLVNPWLGIVYRRIKHFSGYNVTAGRAEEAEERAIDDAGDYY
jgi:hypothetical protein